MIRLVPKLDAFPLPSSVEKTNLQKDDVPWEKMCQRVSMSIISLGSGALWPLENGRRQQCRTLKLLGGGALADISSSLDSSSLPAPTVSTGGGLYISSADDYVV